MALGAHKGQSQFADFAERTYRPCHRHIKSLAPLATQAGFFGALANEIDSDLYEKKPDHFFDISWLAEFQLCLERAVSVLDKNVTQVASLSVSGNEVGHFDHGSPAAEEGRGV